MRRRRELVVPTDLAVVVGVNVDPAWRDQRTVRVDDLAGRVADRSADRDDPAIFDRHVAGVRGIAGAVDDRAALDHVVMHR